MIWVIGIVARLGVPERFQRAAAWIALALALVALLTASWLTWLHFHDKAVIEKHEEGITAEVATRKAEADAAATQAAGTTTNRVELENEDARKAADGAADPLKSGLDRLRAGSSKDRPATR